jgi:hypothetical protein
VDAGSKPMQCTESEQGKTGCCQTSQEQIEGIYMKAKIEELETNSKIKNVRDLYQGINDFKKG